jgi:aspartate/methionine/tyrosine aminotransferase
MASEYEERIDYCVKRINEMQYIKCVKPEGAFYLFPDISETGLKSSEFTNQLYEQEKLRIASGSGYGPEMGEGHVRLALIRPLSYQTMPSWFEIDSDKTLEAAMDRLEAFTKSIAQ